VPALVLVPMVAPEPFMAMITLARMAMVPLDNVGVRGGDSACQSDRDKSEDDCVSHVSLPVLLVGHHEPPGVTLER
jgi:hypothetical protein